MGTHRSQLIKSRTRKYQLMNSERTKPNWGMNAKLNISHLAAMRITICCDIFHIAIQNQLQP